MSRFYPLKIADVRQETRDAVLISFEVPEALRDSFKFQPGQHLTLRTDIDGQDVRRSYSICSAVEDGDLRVVVKRVPDGLFSTWANGQLHPAQVLDVMPPMGHFNVPLSPEHRRHYVAFAAGSGITPVFSLIKTVLQAEPLSRFTLFFGNRASSTVILREELADLKDRYLQRFNLVHVMSREPQDIDLLNGRITAEKCEQLLRHWAPPGEVDTFFVCGPGEMMQAVEEVLHRQGVAADKIKIERFATSVERGPRPAHSHPVVGRHDAEITIVQDGRQRSFPQEKNRASILDAALAEGIEVPYSCKSGVCSTCRCRVVEGEVDMDVNFALEDYEIKRGFVLACQSYPVSDKVVLDFDQDA